MKSLKKSLCFALLLAGLCVSAPSARAAVEEHLPADTAALLRVTNLERHYEEFVSSPLAARLRDADAFPDLAARLRQAEAGIRWFEQEYEVDVKDVLMAILGREYALAVFPDETGALVAEARSWQDLSEAVEEFQRVQRRAGHLLETRTESYRGLQLHAAELHDGKTRYHAIHGRVLVVSEQRAAVERVIDTLTGERPAIATRRDYRDAMRMAEPGAFAVGYVSPAALQHVAAQVRKESESPGSPVERFVQAQIADVVDMMHLLVLNVVHGQDLEARVSVAYRPERVPDVLKDALPQTGTRLDAMDLAPRQAAVTCAGSLDPLGTWNVLTAVLDESLPWGARRARAGMDALVAVVGGVYSHEELLAQFTGQSILTVLPAGESDGPPSVAYAVGLRQTDYIPRALESVVGAIVAFARADGRPVRTERTRYEDVWLTSVRVDEPGVWRWTAPTFGVVKDHLVLASSPDAARTVIDTARGAPRATVPRLQGTPFGAAVMNARVVKGMLEQYQSYLVRHAVEKEGKSEAQAHREQAALRKLLSLMEGVHYVETFEEDRTHHHVQIRLVHEAR